MDWKKILAWLNEPISNFSITIFRIVFGVILLIQTYYFIANGFIENNIIKPFILFPFINGLQPLSESGLILISYIMLTSNIGMLFNKTARISILIFLFCFTYFWLLDKSYFNNHYYFISIMCFLLFLVDRHSSFRSKIYVPRISLFSLQFMVFLTYFIAGLNKLNPYWLVDLQPMGFILEAKCDTTENMLFIHPLLVGFMSYFGVLFDLAIGFLLFFRRTKLTGFVLAISFNIINHLLFLEIGEIGVFPFIMISTLILFIEPEKLIRKFNVFKEQRAIKTNSSILNKFIICFLTIQIILPFRHVFFKGYVDYNGIGQRFSWRMKSLCKESWSPGYMVFKVYRETFDPTTKRRGGKKFLDFDLNKMHIFLRDSVGIQDNLYLTENQKEKLLYYPDLLPDFAKKIESLNQFKTVV